MDNYFHLLNSFLTYTTGNKELWHCLSQKMGHANKLLAKHLETEGDIVRWKKAQEGSLPPHQHTQTCRIGSFCRWRRKWIKTCALSVTSMGFVDFSDMMANSFIISCKVWKWPKKLFIYLVDLSILNAFIVYRSWGNLCIKCSRTNCRESYPCCTGYKLLRFYVLFKERLLGHLTFVKTVI